MFTRLSKRQKEASPMNHPKVGDIYKTVELDGKSFELKYGYYEEYEKDRTDPIPIYPDFKKEPVYTSDGKPFVTAMQDVCQHFEGEQIERLCFECRYYSQKDELIGVCNNAKNRINEP